ncbi:hypothetical protein M5K25_012335 [Dendrobium thyrsiflorum]|uniref:Uncharacterized protein n=1 Tax=Dendrobium thyrsiflorum TaxID=117978 RepID=A0ABD0UWQ7_DENTH
MPPLEPLFREEMSMGYDRRGADFVGRMEEFHRRGADFEGRRGEYDEGFGYNRRRKDLSEPKKFAEEIISKLHLERVGCFLELYLELHHGSGLAGTDEGRKGHNRCNGLGQVRLFPPIIEFIDDTEGFPTAGSPAPSRSRDLS